ncbi:endonuclease III domain-containing protein [Pseudothermotoga sp. U03pept]|uniref:endonuclease III domain-containing protein n=1 Tax=Pseudothermotoga sp. U03pept TaxID=3447012 RepID=UPI003F0E9779
MTDLLLQIYRTLFDMYGPQGWWPAESWFEVVVGAILTQNTSWKNVEKVISNLKRNGLLKPERLFSLSKEEIAALIKPAGFYNLKANRLKNLMDLLNKYNFDFDNLSKKLTREELLSVKGVGKESCDSILLYAFNRPIFVVDSYTRRIFSRLAVVKPEDDYDEIQKLFQLIPQNVEIYKEYHALIVKHAKELCTKNKPKCPSCPIKNHCRYLIQPL